MSVGDGLRGVYCLPVSRSHYKTHQWLRDLKRRGMKTIQAIQFYIPSNQEVFIGQYNRDFIKVTASEALGIFETHETGLGLEVVIPRSVARSEIKRAYTPNQVLGWRFYPTAKGKRPFCGCKFCNRGEINAYRVITETDEETMSIKQKIAEIKAERQARKANEIAHEQAVE